MGRGYSALCRECQTQFEVNEGSGMNAMPFHCDRCGKEWWWEFGLGGPMDKEANPPRCGCGGRFTESAPPRCPSCGSSDLEQDPGGHEIMYD
jgi:predicted Zn finger-like uncharacterized protein